MLIRNTTNMQHCRRATADEITTLLGWAAAEGWNPGHDDAEAFYAADPNGFFVVTDNRQPVACVSVVRQGEITDGAAYGFLGLYLCKPDFRGTGLGLRVWQAGMEYLDGHTVALDGVVDQQSNYQKSGFALAYRNIRYTGAADKLGRVLPAYSKVDGISIRRVKDTDIEKLVELDQAINGVNRSQYLSHWFTDTSHRHTLVAEQETADGLTIVAVGTIRACLENFKIGPLLSGDASIARRLIAQLVTTVGATAVSIDVPEPNTVAADLATEAGLLPVFETARMYRGQQPVAKLDRVFGVCTLELG